MNCENRNLRAVQRLPRHIRPEGTVRHLDDALEVSTAVHL